MDSGFLHSTIDEKHAVLQRRSSIADVRPLLDGVAVVSLAYWLILLNVGALTAEYTVMVVLLLGALGLLYDIFSIYRKNTSFTRKALDLLQAWTLAFAILLVLGFVTKQSEGVSRLLLVELYASGYAVQLGVHASMRLLVKELFRHQAQSHNAIIVGTGQLAGYLHQRIRANEWLGQKVVGFVRLNSAADSTGNQAFEQEGEVLGALSELMTLIREHSVRT